MAAELREHAVRANVVCPGAKTRLSTGPQYEAHIAGLNRRGLLDDVSAQAALDAPAPEYAAPVYAYLAGDFARDITGRIFIAAGGFVGEFARPSPACHRLPRPSRLATVVAGGTARDDQAVIRQRTPRAALCIGPFTTCGPRSPESRPRVRPSR